MSNEGNCVCSLHGLLGSLNLGDSRKVFFDSFKLLWKSCSTEGGRHAWSQPARVREQAATDEQSAVHFQSVSTRPAALPGTSVSLWCLAVLSLSRKAEHTQLVCLKTSWCILVLYTTQRLLPSGAEPSC